MSVKSSLSLSPSNSKSRTALCCKSPCNEFLVSHLLSLRNSEARGKHFGSSKHHQPYHKFQMYNRVIQSVRRYPMPIICEQQLGMLAGVGDMMIGKMIAIVKGHYKKFLGGGNGREDSGWKDENGKGSENSETSERMVSLSGRKVLFASQCSNINSIRSEGGEDSEYDSEKRDKMAIFPSSQKFLSECDQKSSKSDTWTKKNQIYKPRQGSQTANVLRIMKSLGAVSRSVTKKDLDKYCLENSCEKIKQWKNTKQTLIKYGYIETDPSCQQQSYFLTSVGLSFLSSNEQSEYSNQIKNRILQEVNSFKSKYQKQEQDWRGQSNSQTHSQSRTQNISKNPNEPFILKKKVSLKQNQRLIIIVDTREMKDQSEKTYFQETLRQKYKVEVMTHVLSIGDFAFCYDGQLLDYIIERKKADDLAASIIDGRYKEQKYRLKNSGAANIIYLYEGYPSDGSMLREKQLFNALLKTRVSENFKVQKTARINESVKYLASMYEQLQRRIQTGGQVTTIGTLEDFNRRNAKNRYLTVENVFGFGLKSFPNAGKQTVTNLMRYFKSYFSLYQELKKYKNNAERVEFLNGLLKGGRTQAGVTTMITQFLFGVQDKEFEANLEKSQLDLPKRWWDDQSLKKYQSQ